MTPWKMFVRSVAAVALLTAGGFAAGQELPFSHASRGVSPSVEVDESPTGEETPDVEPAAEVDEETTTTTPDPEVETPETDSPETEAPETGSPETGSPETDTAETAVPDVEVTDDLGSIEPRIVAAPAVERTRPAPAPEARPARKDCRVTHPWKGDHNNDGHCDQGWHNKDAEWVADKGGRPETAPGRVKNAERHGEGRR